MEHNDRVSNYKKRADLCCILWAAGDPEFGAVSNLIRDTGNLKNTFSQYGNAAPPSAEVRVEIRIPTKIAEYTKIREC